MLIWYVGYTLAIYLGLFGNPRSNLYLYAFSFICIADIYGLNIGGVTYTMFSLFSALTFFRVLFVRLDLVQANLFIKKILLENKGINSFGYTFISVLILGFSGILYTVYNDNENLLLYFKPLIFLIQWLGISYLIFHSYALIEKKIIKQKIWHLVLLLSMMILLICYLEAYGPIWNLTAASSTYDIHEIRTWGVQNRPTGLTREPAHLVMVMLACLLGCYKQSVKNKTVIILIWLIIGELSQARTLYVVMFAYLFLSTLLLGDKKVIKKILVIVSIFIMLIGLYSVSDRFQSSFSIESDASTLVRYSLLIASISTYHYDPLHFYGIGSLVDMYCRNGIDEIGIYNIICPHYQEMILNWTINFLSILPIYILYIFTIYFIWVSKYVDKLVIVSSLLGGMIFYYWSYPASGLLLFLIPTLLKISYDE
jgi:hypothetical protein